MLQLIQKVEEFIKKIRWKAIFFMKCGNETEPATHKTELTFGLNSTKFPPQVKELMYHLKQTSSTESKLTAQVTILSH